MYIISNKMTSGMCPKCTHKAIPKHARIVWLYKKTSICFFCHWWMWLNTKMFIWTVDKKVHRDSIIMGFSYIQTSNFFQPSPWKLLIVVMNSHDPLQKVTLTTTQLQLTTFLAFPSLSILQRPAHSPSFLLSSTWKQAIKRKSYIQLTQIFGVKQVD